MADEQQAGQSGAGPKRRGVVKTAKRQVRAAKRDVKAARKTPERGDNAEARASLSRARRNVDLATEARKRVRQAKRTVTATAETPGERDDRLAKKALAEARKNRRQVGRDIRKGRDAGALDTLSKKALASQYEYAYEVLRKDPELWDLFRRATAGETGWTTERFTAKLRETEWWKSRSASERAAWAQEAAGGRDWEETQRTAREAVQRRASAIGASLTPEQWAALSDRYITQGWDENEDMLDDALADYLQTGAGAAGEAAAQLRAVAQRNGQTYSDQWYENRVAQIARGEATTQDFEYEIREAAASAFPPVAERLRAGEDMADIASNYVNRMAEVLELAPDSLTVNDPTIRQAFGGVDAQGNPTVQGMWDFEKQLRKDQRYSYTKGAHDEAMNYGYNILQMFGFQA